ncbi:alginate O-acetyltransferase complex protein AlgJ [Pseudacidovorax intermedius]|uniref:Alginate O-acetyltransferase complex protein AlgJ n=1 Tax=Pseudacidovorax intermedius TaxID=433924 RepID=A0A370FAB1_9BURK|nr:twin-arginine translocation pathway signal [Pseudacidovorax intermedius]RDI21918.1 alginate O-acetyltransferase complex protein AlgJ [Pseudacidovorax intermedius]
MTDDRTARGLRRRHLLGLPMGLALAGLARAQPADNLAFVGQDNYIFAAWDSLTTPDWKGINATVARVAQVGQLLAAKGVALVVPVLPDKMRIYEEKLPADKPMSPEMRQRYAGILSRLQAAGVATFDDEKLLIALKAAGQPVYYRTDQHWAQPAADATAQATADLIRQKVPNLAGQPGTGMALGPLINERRYGDLADRFLSPEQRRAVGREIYSVRRAGDGESLLADAPSPVHVTGNSMVQPYFGFPQKLSNLLDRPVSVNWKPGDVGFWRVLLEYVESNAFRQQKPQALVWQLFEPNFHLGPDARGLWDSASVVSAEEWQRRIQAALA